MLPALGLTLLGYVLAFAPLLLGMKDLPDPLVAGVMGVGVALGWRGWARRRPSRGRLAGASALTLIVLVHYVWMFHFSAYGAPKDAPDTGARPADEIAATRVRDGATFRLAAQRGRRVLLVFFRGAW